MFGSLKTEPKASFKEVPQPTVLSPLEQSFQTADAAWKENSKRLHDLKDRFEAQREQLSPSAFSKMQQDIDFLESVTERSHQRMSEALSALERFQFQEGQKHQLAEKQQQLETLNAQIGVCDAEINNILAQERVLPARRLQIQGRRSDLWRLCAVLKEEIRRVENVHSR